MRRTILAAVPLAVLALAAPAAADGGSKHATTYKARLAPVAAAPVASAAERGEEREDRIEGARGKAHLVDGRRRDEVALHVKGLTAGERYTWSVRQVAPAAEASNDGVEAGDEESVDGPEAGDDSEAGEAPADCAGETVAAFEYQPLVSRRHGHGKARARSRAFAAEEGATYVIAVTAADGTDVACGEFEAALTRKQAKAKRKAERRAAKRKAADKGGKHGDKHESDEEDEESDDEDLDEDEGGDEGDDADDDDATESDD